MAIKIFYYGYFMDIVGKRVVSLEIDRARIKNIIDKNVLEKTRGELVILVNGVPSSIDGIVKDGDEVKVLPHMGGG